MSSIVLCVLFCVEGVAGIEFEARFSGGVDLHKGFVCVS